MIAHDCLGHGVNFVVRGPLFVMREQLQKLADLRSKKGFKEVAEHKISGGYHLSIFRDFFVKDGLSYSINHGVTFSAMKQQNWRHLLEFLQHTMIASATYDQLLFTGTGHIDYTYTHSGAFLRQVINGQPIIVYLDSANKEPLYSNPMIALMGKKLDYQKQFAPYFMMELWTLDGVAVN
jgi:hypothetical protein